MTVSKRYTLYSALIISSLILSFQNCAKKPLENSTLECESSGTCNNKTGSSFQASSSSSGASLGGSSRTTSSSGSFGGSTGSSGNGSFGGSSTSTGGSYTGVTTSGSGTTGSTTGTMSIVTHPTHVNVLEGTDFTLKITTTGEPPTSYKWYKNGALLQYCTYWECALNARSHADAGNYYVVITNSKGQSVQSNTATVSIADPNTPCAAGVYFIGENKTAYNGDDHNTFFVNTSGKFLLSDKNENVKYMLESSTIINFYGVKKFNFPLQNFGSEYKIKCTTNLHIPQIHNQVNFWWWNNNGNYVGDVTFQCRGNKWKFVSDTCHWEQSDFSN